MQFSMRPIDETIEDIRQQAQFYQGKKINSCFLQDGDALVLKTDYFNRPNHPPIPVFVIRQEAASSL